MLAYIVRRTLYVVPVVLGVTLITFVLFNIVGGNPVYQKLGRHGSEAEVKILTHEMGLDLPLYQQYGFYLKQCLTFDFGRSWSTNQTISSMIIAGIGPSLSLAIPAFATSVILSILISLGLAFVRGGFLDRATTIICLAGISVSLLVYIICFQYMLSYKWGLFPISGYETGWDNRWQYLLLPGIIWVVTSLGNDVLLYRTIMLDEIFQDYVRTARAKGLPEKLVLLKHVLKNAMIPIITNIVLEIPFLYTGSLLLENFFGIPGLGGMTVQALASADFPVIKTMTYVGSLLYVAFNLISDVGYAVFDPRINLE